MRQKLLAIFAVLVIVLGAWVVCFVQAQHAPHHITRYLGGHPIEDYWTTNNIEVRTECRQVMTPTGFEFRMVTVTNELWQIW